MNDIIIVTTSTCPNCKKAKELLDNAGLMYKVIDAEENRMFCQENNIVQAPTLLVEDKKYVNLSNIIKFIEETNKGE